MTYLSLFWILFGFLPEDRKKKKKKSELLKPSKTFENPSVNHSTVMLVSSLKIITTIKNYLE